MDFTKCSESLCTQCDNALFSSEQVVTKFDAILIVCCFCFQFKGSCDLYHGKWVYDPAGPLYTSNTCPIITQTQNCQVNGRPDKEYVNYRWNPDGCDLPRFDAKKFLELMRHKTLAFVGDSVARNQMESLVCILWQARTLRLLFWRHNAFC